MLIPWQNDLSLKLVIGYEFLMGAGEVVEWLATHGALVEDWSWVYSIHIGRLITTYKSRLITTYKSSYRASNILFWTLGIPAFTFIY